jgi:hypothetical protein
MAIAGCLVGDDGGLNQMFDGSVTVSLIGYYVVQYSTGKTGTVVRIFVTINMCSTGPGMEIKRILW